MKFTKTLSLLFIFLFSTSSVIYSSENPAESLSGVVTKTLYSKVLDQNRVLYIYVPETSKDTKLPVIYLLDGEFVDRYKEAYEFAQSAPHIIVGLHMGETRNYDVLPVKVENRANSGGGPRFLEFFTTELLPYIDTNYNTSGNNIIMGGSNSALFTLYAMFTTPKTFSAFIPSSPMIGHCPEFMYDLLRKFDRFDELKDKHLYIMHGMKDRYKQATEFLPDYIKELKEHLKGMNIRENRLEDGGHVPENSFLYGLRFVYSNP